MDESTLETVAYHEAGHVVIAIHLGGIVEAVTIEPDRDDGPKREGDVRVVWNTTHISRRDLCEKSMMVALAGPVAEMIFSGDPFHPGFVAEWSHDWRTAWSAAELLIHDERQRLQLLEQTTKELHQICSRDDMWQAIAALADELSAHETLESEQIMEAIGPWLP